MELKSAPVTTSNRVTNVKLIPAPKVPAAGQSFDEEIHVCPVEENKVLEQEAICLGEPQINLPKNSFSETLKCYKELWKMRLSGLVVFTAAGTYISCGGTDWKSCAALCAGTFLQAACANTLNEVYEADLDAQMTRTKNRPLPTKRITKKHALIQAAIAGVGGTCLLYSCNNTLTASLGAANIVLYAGVYTPLKTRSILNTWVGTLNGSIPPLMGCAAATGTLNDTVGLFMGGILYLWQISHFMAINYKCRSDYGRAGYKMLANEDPEAAASQALLHSALLFPLCWWLSYKGEAPYWFAALSTPVNYYLLMKPAITFKRKVNYDNATKLFFKSLGHLCVLFVTGMVATTWKRSVKDAVVQSSFWKTVKTWFGF